MAILILQEGEAYQVEQYGELIFKGASDENATEVLRQTCKRPDASQAFGLLLFTLHIFEDLAQNSING